MQVCLVRRRRDGGGLAFILEGVGILMAKKSAFAKMEWNSLIYLDLSPINMKADNCSSGKKNGGKKKRTTSTVLSKGNKTSWHTVLFVETAPGCMPQSVSHVEGGSGKTYVAFYSLM